MTTLIAAPNGTSSGSGTEERPFDLRTAMVRANPGDEVRVRGGRDKPHPEIYYPTLKAGTPSAPIKLRPYPGDNPLVRGRFWVRNLQYWDIEIDVTWRDGDDYRWHMIKTDGTGKGWVWRDSEIFGSKSWASWLLADAHDDFRITGIHFHDVGVPENGHSIYQDHHIYSNLAHNTVNNGLIDHCIFRNATRGNGVKLDATGGEPGGGMGIVVEYNTFVNCRRGVLIGGSANRNKVRRNLFASMIDYLWYVYKPVSGFGQNEWLENLVWGKTVTNGSHSGWRADPNQVLDPKLDALFRPTIDAARAYGHTAGLIEPAPEPIPEDPTPEPTPEPNQPAPAPEPVLTPATLTEEEAEILGNSQVDRLRAMGFEVVRR